VSAIADSSTEDGKATLARECSDTGSEQGVCHTPTQFHSGQFRPGRQLAGRDWGCFCRATKVYLDTSSVVFGRYLEQAARELPAEKLIFGSDGPLIDSRVELHKIRLLRLPREKEELVLGRNVLRLLGG